METQEAISLAGRINEIGLNGVLFLVALVMGYIVYRFILTEHKKLMSDLERLGERIERIATNVGHANDLFERSGASQAEVITKAFSVIDGLREKNQIAVSDLREQTLAALSEINHKLDLLLAERPARRKPQTKAQ
jgi:hypothetical protein